MRCVERRATSWCIRIGVLVVLAGTLPGLGRAQNAPVVRRWNHVRLWTIARTASLSVDTVPLTGRLVEIRGHAADTLEIDTGSGRYVVPRPLIVRVERSTGRIGVGRRARKAFFTTLVTGLALTAVAAQTCTEACGLIGIGGIVLTFPGSVVAALVAAGSAPRGFEPAVLPGGAASLSP